MNLLSQKCDEEIAMNDRAKNNKQLQDSFQISSGLHMKTKELKLKWPYGAHKPFARWSERHSMALSSLHWLVDSSSIERNKGNRVCLFCFYCLHAQFIWAGTLMQANIHVYIHVYVHTCIHAYIHTGWPLGILNIQRNVCIGLLYEVCDSNIKVYSLRS